MEEVKKETAGQAEERMDALRTELRAGLSDDVKAKLDTAISDVEVCKILADAGVDLDQFEKKIEDAGFNMKKIGLQLPDDNLAEVSGGFYDDFLGAYFDCPCGNNNRDDFSRQYWLGMVRRGRYYRCKKCNRFIVIAGTLSFRVFDDKEAYDKAREYYKFD